MLYVLLLKIGIAIAMAGGLAFGVHTYNIHQQDIGYQRAVSEYQVKLIAAQESARKTEANWKRQQEVSNVNATKRQQVLAANLATANLINSGLRGEADDLRQRLSDPAVGATSDGIAAIKTVLGECTREIESYAGKDTELAASCDRHVNDLQRYHEQWPKVESK